MGDFDASRKELEKIFKERTGSRVYAIDIEMECSCNEDSQKGKKNINKYRLDGRCSAGELIRGDGKVDKDTVWTPNSFQSMDPDRDSYGASDLLLLDYENKPMQYIGPRIENSDGQYMRRSWRKGDHNALAEFERRRSEMRQRECARGSRRR